MTTSLRRTLVRSIAVGATLLVGLFGLGGCRPAPSNISVSIKEDGLSQPWDLEFSPGRSIFFTEKAGPIKVRLAGNDGEGEIRTLADPTDEVTMGEGGMMGLALDPHFSDNRRIYTCFLSNKSGSLDVRIVRWRVTNDLTRLHLRADIVTGLPVNQSGQTGRHSGCRPRFGPDGNLWIGTGDAATGSVPQSPTSLGGKVLRVDTNGAGVPGNMTAPFDHRIYNYGHRNVQGIAFSPGGKAYSIEHGTDRDDEVNLLVAGGNYGWDPRPPGGGSGYDESQPMTNTTKYPNARRPAWTSGSSTIAPSGGTFLRGSQWAGWDGALVLAVLKGQQLRVLAFNKDGTDVVQEWTTVTNRGRLRSVVRGEAGNAYVIQDATPSSILRIHPTK